MKMNGSELFSKLKTLKHNDRILLLTNADIDGAGCEILLRYTVIPERLTVKRLREHDMGHAILNAVCNDAKDYDTIIACNLPCSTNDADIIDASGNGSKLIIFNYHLANCRLNKYPFGVCYHGMVTDSFRVPMFKDSSYEGLSSSTSLMYDYLHYVNLVDTNRSIDHPFDCRDAVLREIVHLTATYITRDWINCFGKDLRYLDFGRLFDIYGYDHYTDIMLKKALRCKDEASLADHQILRPTAGNDHLLDSIDRLALEIDADKRKDYLDQIQSRILTGNVKIKDCKYYAAYIDNNKYIDDVFELMRHLYPYAEMYIMNHGSNISVRWSNNTESPLANIDSFQIPMSDIFDMLSKTVNADMTFRKRGETI